MRIAGTVLSAIVLSAIFAWGILVGPSSAEPTASGHDLVLYQRTLEGGIAYLKKNQSPDGSFAGATGPGVTALVATGLMRNGRSQNDPMVAAALAYLEKSVRPDGGIYQEKSLYQNYETCLAIVCFEEANRQGRYTKIIRRADAFVKRLQWDEGEGHDSSSNSFGGAGYGRHKRPDLSNTSFLIDALRAAGNGPDDEAMKRALLFVSRCQNLETEHNTTKFSAKNPDGGFYYTPAAGGTSQAGEATGGALRSYGSMTYAGLKSMIYAGVGPDDPRVKAAVQWIRLHYSITENPGLGDAGLYYYYHLFAKSLDALGLDQIEEPSGKKHDWRRELIVELARRQKPDGSWNNENVRWLEGEPQLVTGYVLLTLAYCRDF